MQLGRFTGAIKRGATAVQAAYVRQKKAAELRAKKRMAHARSQYERARVKAEAEREQLTLKRKMYEAKAAALRERDAVARARKAAGEKSWSERAGDFLSTTRKSIRQLQRGTKPRRRTIRRKRA